MLQRFVDPAAVAAEIERALIVWRAAAVLAVPASFKPEDYA
jgi:hypothetical protein